MFLVRVENVLGRGEIRQMNVVDIVD